MNPEAIPQQLPALIGTLRQIWPVVDRSVVSPPRHAALAFESSQAAEVFFFSGVGHILLFWWSGQDSLSFFFIKDFIIVTRDRYVFVLFLPQITFPVSACLVFNCRLGAQPRRCSAMLTDLSATH